VWLICKITLGRGKNKILVRGIKGAEWVFCPTIRSTKRDRVSIDRCQRCRHFIRLDQQYILQARTKRKTFSFGKTTSKGICRIAGLSRKSKITHPRPRSLPHIPNLTKERELLLDVFEEKDHLVIIAELPSVDENNVGIKTEENMLTISAGHAARKYRKRIQLPTSIKKDTIESTYKNNILQVIFEKLCTTKNG